MNKLVIDATNLSHWIGGLYYRKNIIFSLLQNDYISNKFEIIVLVDSSSEHTFDMFYDKVTIKCIKYSNERHRKLIILLFCITNKIKFIFPFTSNTFNCFGIKTISWIPDFQCNRLPEYFSKDEITKKAAYYAKIANGDSPLVLSSNDSLADFKKYYDSNRTNIYVVHFVSFIEKDICDLSDTEENQTLRKYNLSGKHYACIMNQFWKHKNHITVFKAIKLWAESNPYSDFTFAFTGELYDYRNPEYITLIRDFVRDPAINRHILLLGLIDRREQLTVMKHSQYVIQPSLFEGWGTVVEDAKVLDKTVLLSDIPVHREQMSPKCVLFDPNSPEKLAELIAQENKKVHQDDVSKGIYDMHIRAKEYSANFEKMLKDNS